MRKAKNAQAQPFWSNPGTIHHALDKDIIDSIRRGNEKCSILMMMDPHFEHQTNTYHIEWTGDDLETLLHGMLTRSLEILRCAKPTNALFKEEIVWQASPQFAEVCRFAGYDPQVIRDEVKAIMKRYGKEFEVDQLAEFVHWSGFFAEMFKEKNAVKVANEGLIRFLTKQCEGDYELTTILGQILDLMDDLYISGVTAREVMVEFLAREINS
ncbi:MULTISPECIES: hypothetical protein [Shewanella]|uniref:hypothetical protein n=1 Tax=Shewanella TaxID=22 RepID=UPI000B348C73|nr:MULTISPECIES: hypothetical protein [Shewanella]AYV11516.1 hypothetical protein EEY24_00680 [Shewanella algae]QXN27423.1 hypothetical protein KVP08_023310 [Shewanella putrefaciens]